jgi:hypothetical protein
MEQDCESVQVKCPSCDSTVEAQVVAESNKITVLTSAFLVFLLGFWSLLVLPVWVPLTKTISLRCPNCKTLIKKQEIFSRRSLNDQVISIHFGNFALIFSRRYLIYFLIVLTFFCFLATSKMESVLDVSSVKWEDYLSDCSAEKIIKDKNEVVSTFTSKYSGKVVNWQGFLMKATVNQGWFRGEHAAVLLVKMSPTESEVYADLVLTFSQSDLEKCKDQIIRLNRGDQFSFNATLVSVADENSIHHLHGHQLSQLAGFLEIPYDMKTHHRTSAVEIVKIVDKPKMKDHDHIHVYNSTYNSTLE